MKSISVGITSLSIFPAENSRADGKDFVACEITITTHNCVHTYARLPDFSWCMIPKLEKCTICAQNIPNIHEIFQMAIKYINIFQSEALKIFPKLGF
jgi:hypothetical protein